MPLAVGSATTQKLIYEHSSDLPSTDLGYFSESLYKTRKGAWFLVGSGGPMTSYAVPSGSGNVTGSSDVFRPLDVREAVSRRAYETIQEHFEDQTEDA